MGVHRFFGYLRRRFRRSRYQQLRQRFDCETLSGAILDLGGGPASFFASMFPEPKRIVLVDIEYALARRAKEVIPELNVVVADGAKLPFARQSMGLTVCNSVIEHVADPASLAAEIERVSQRYFIQTPNVEFPIETHSYIGIPFYRLIPSAGLRRLMCRFFSADFDYVESVTYLTESQLRRYFKKAHIVHERVLGLTKSFYAIRNG